MTRKRPSERDLLVGLDDEMDSLLHESNNNDNDNNNNNNDSGTTESQKRRLDQARDTIKRLQHDDDDTVDARQIDKDIIAERLRKAATEARGLKQYRHLADPVFRGAAFRLTQTLRSDHRRSPITRLVVSPDGTAFFSADKAGTIIKWRWWKDRLEYRKQHVFKCDQSVLSMAVSPSGEVLLAGRLDGSILAFNLHKNRLLGRLGPNEHRQAVTDLAFLPASMTAVSGSRDRTIKLWSVDQLAYIDTLFGHQDDVMAVAGVGVGVGGERCVSVGGRDRTMRVWKIAEETQLVFRLSESDGGSIEQVVPIDPQSRRFVTGSDTGRLSVWSVGRKKPTHTIIAHQSAVSCLVNPEATDLVISGSDDGWVKLWRIVDDNDGGNQDDVGLELVNELPVPGHVVGAVLIDEETVAVAVGPEGRLGRWTVDPTIKPSILVFKIISK